MKPPGQARLTAKAGTSMTGHTKRPGKATTASKPDEEHAHTKDADPKQPSAKTRVKAGTSMNSRTERPGKATTASKPDEEHAQAKVS